MSVEVRVLGELRASVGVRALALGPPMQRALFAVLVLRANELVTVDQLIEALWEEQAPRTAAKIVQTYVSKLRSELDESAAIDTRRPGYVLRIDPEAIDAVRFERLAGEASAELSARKAAEALALWRGRPLAEFAYRGFAQPVIARLEEIHAGVLETRFEAELAQGKHDHLVPEIEAAVRENPLRERLRGQLMLALYRAGRQAEALEAFQDARRTLVDELGIDPSSALQALERAILTQDPSLHVAPVEVARNEAVTQISPPEEIPAPVGRDTEYDAVTAFLDGVANGARGLVLAGPAGIGKTTVWEAGVADADRRGWPVLSVRAAAAEAQLSYAGFGDLFDSVAERVLAELPMPQRRGLEAALGLSEMGSPPDSRLLGLGLLNALRLLATDGPLVIAIDDLQWFDAPSAELLTFALRRLENEPVALLASVRTGEAGAEAEVERALGGRLARMAVGPLSIGAVQKLLRARLGASPSRVLLRRIYDRSGGNPFYALELARTVSGQGDERMPESLRALVAGRIELLPDDTRSLLLLLSESMQPTLALVRDLGQEDALDPAERADVIVVDGTKLRFSHPLLAAAAQDVATTRERRAANRRLADHVGDPEQRARHLALAAEGPDEAIAEALDAAVASALARGALANATELAEHALSLTPPGNRAALHRRRIEAARRNQTVGNSRREHELLEAALADASNDRERAEALNRLAEFAVNSGDLTTVREMIAEALRCAAGDDALTATILLESSSLDTGYGSSLENAQAALGHAERSGDPALEAWALSNLAQSTFIHGCGFRRDLFERAIELESAAGFIPAALRPSTNYGWAAKWAGDIELGRRLLERSAARLRDEEDMTASSAVFYLGWLHFIAGEWEQALDRFDESRQFGLDAAVNWDAALSLIGRSVIEAHQGRLSEAKEHLCETRSFADIFQPIWEFGQAMASLSSGDPAAAAESLGPAMAQVMEKGVEDPGMHPWFPTQTQALIETGRIDEAEKLVDWMEERATRVERRWALAMCAHMRGAITAARGDPDAAIEHLQRAVELHDGIGRPFDRAWTFLAHGQALRRAKQRRAAREALEEALREFEKVGAALWAEKARDELSRIGGRAPASTELTPTEERIAELVVQGKSNKEVAAELFLTVRTVETNLSRIYAKLGVRSRTELAALSHGTQADT